MTYRWLESDEILEWVNPECARHGWVQFNINTKMPTCRVLGAFDGPELVAFFGFSLIPHLGPMWADQTHRNGAVSFELAGRMADFMNETRARGAVMIADNAATERLAQKFGLERVTAPVFVWNPHSSVAPST